MAALTASGPAPASGRERGPFRARFDSTGAVLLLALRKSDPRMLWRNPVIFLVLIGAILTTAVAITDLASGGAEPSGGTDFPPGFNWALAFWLWATLVTANIAEALAEGRGRSETAALRARREGTTAHRVRSYDPAADPGALEAQIEDVDSADLRPGDIVVVVADEIVPTDGEVVWGSASLDESETTGVAGAVIRSTGGDRSAVTGATTVLTDRIVVRVTARQGATVVDTMIDLAEGRVRQKSPTELALFALLASFTLSFVLIALTLNVVATTVAPALTLPVLITIVVCLIPAEIAALLSVTGLAGMYQLLERNVLVDSSHALDTAGAITTVVLDKTGTITEGERQATAFVTMASANQAELARTALLASLDDPSPEGISTIALAAERGFVAAEVDVEGRVPVPFSALTRISGCDLPDGTQIRKGGEAAILEWIAPPERALPQSVVDHLHSRTESIARAGGTPMVIATKPAVGPPRLVGVVDFKDVIRSSVRTRIGRVRAHGIRVLMVTGDNSTTADAIAKVVGVTACQGDASAIDKLEVVRKAQEDGHFVAMGGDGTNDAAALAQADIGVAMNSSTAAAKAAANMVILDDDPTKILDIVEIGRRQMATRGALVTFNLANDLVRYFTLFPALFVGAFPGLDALNLLRLHSPASAILSTVIFGVVVIGILIPLALAGVPYRTVDLSRALGRNLLFYGVGGIVVAAAAIKLIDLIVSLVPGY